MILPPYSQYSLDQPLWLWQESLVGSSIGPWHPALPSGQSRRSDGRAAERRDTSLSRPQRFRFPSRDFRHRTTKTNKCFLALMLFLLFNA